MNGSLKPAATTEFVPYLEQAKRRFPDKRISGHGAFALVTPFPEVSLYETRAEAVAQIGDPKYCSIVELTLEVTPKCMNRKDDAEDRAWSRRFDRERRQNA